MTTIYLIRHSDSIKSNNINWLSLIDEQTKNENLPLSILGESKALKISEYKEFSEIDAVFSSTYQRAISTAKYIAEKNKLQINITNLLNERKLGNTEGIPKSFWLTQIEDEFAKAPNGENRNEVSARMLDVINMILKDYKEKKVVLVSHATAITFLLMNWCELKNVDLETKLRYFTYNDKEVINDKFRCPEIFKIDFEDDNIIDISVIRREVF